MANALEPVNNDLTIENFTITSLEKLDNNYIHLIGQRGYNDINVVTNGVFTLDFSHFSKIKKIISYDYSKMLQLIAKMEGQGLDYEQAQIEAFYASRKNNG